MRPLSNPWDLLGFHKVPYRGICRQVVFRLFLPAKKTNTFWEHKAWYEFVELQFLHTIRLEVHKFTDLFTDLTHKHVKDGSLFSF